MAITHWVTSRRSPRWIACLLLSLAACGSGDAGSGAMDLAAPSDFASAPDLAGPSACAALGLPARAFDAKGPYGSLRDDLAADFTVTDQAGEWSLAGRWSGCESYVFLPDNVAISPLDSTSIWSQDLDGLLAAADAGGARNVHFFFLSTKIDPTASLQLLADQLDGALAQFPDGDQPGGKEWWRARVHLVQTPASRVTLWVAKALRGQQVGIYGFAIDRTQRIRALGNFADVDRFDGALQAAGQWPWQNNLAYAANPPIYFNYEVARQAAFDGEKGVTEVRVYDHELVGGGHEKDVQLPDAATMATFDTLEIDLTMACPDGTKPEEAEGNCGAWDYLAGVSFQTNRHDPPPDGGDPDGGAPAPVWTEAARFITTYHRAGRFSLGASHFLPYLAAGGLQRISVNVANTYLTTLALRLSKAGGPRPVQSSFLFGGGGFDPSYDPARMTPVSVAIRADARKVELHAIITGHGNPGCAEFCNHQHVFSINGKSYRKEFPEASSGNLGDPQGCMKKVSQGAVPNQSGTWWYGRGGWCPGMQVDPWVVDVTDAVKPGTTATVSYQGLYMNKPPSQGLGNIVMSSWLVISR